MADPLNPGLPVVDPIEDQRARAAAAAQTNTAQDWTGIRVYSGRMSQGSTQRVEISPGSGIYKDIINQPEPMWITAGELANEWYQMDAVERKRYKDTFILMGLINPQRATDQDYSQIWTSYAQQLARYNAASPGTRITIGDLLQADLKQKEEQDPTFAELLRTGKKTTTRTATNIQKSSSLDSRALMDQAARALLGRKATDAENAKLLSALNKMETENPETTTTTQEEDMYGQILSQNSVTSGGVTQAARQQLAQQQAEANPEYGAYQAATTYMGSLMDMVYGKGY